MRTIKLGNHAKRIDVMDINPGEFYSIREVSMILKVTRQLTAKFINTNQLKSYRFGRFFKIMGCDLKSFLLSHVSHYQKKKSRVEYQDAEHDVM